MKANLHTHSKYSDGTQWPEEIVARARKIGLHQMALTDHDCMEGVEPFIMAAQKAGIQAIAGVEIDCVAPEIKYNSEVMGYFPNGNWTHTREFCLKRIEHREKRIKKLISLASDHFQADLSFEELKAYKIGTPPPSLKDPLISYSKPDLYNYLMKRKKLIPEDMDYGVFKKLPFLANDQYPKPSVREVIAIILRDTGIPVLPHPGLIFERNIDRMKTEGFDIFAWFKHAGIRALECNYYKEKDKDNTRELNHLTQQFARKLDLKISWGSDCHGPGHNSDTLEIFWGTRGFPFPGIWG
ncbi:MAG: PHP domain-containing protein [Candidatus Aminicenantes bacterium]|nr:PHP domain-containing protein [Candidatus Aminicenantes bacterium]